MLHITADQADLGKPTGLLCPITGSPLIYDGYEWGTMDGDFYYHAESDPTIKFESNMRSVFYELVGGEKEWGMTGSERVLSRRYFKPEANGTWSEWFAVKSHGFPKLFPIGTPSEEVLAWQAEDERKHLEHKAEYDRKVASGEITPWIVPMVNFGTIANDLVEVKPMDPPSGQIFYFEHTVVSKLDQIVYPFLVTLENIAKIKADFKKDDILVGDEIDSWETGGPLSMRGGEQVLRAGNIIHKRLTKMS